MAKLTFIQTGKFTFIQTDVTDVKTSKGEAEMERLCIVKAGIL